MKPSGKILSPVIPRDVQCIETPRLFQPSYMELHRQVRVLHRRADMFLFWAIGMTVLFIIGCATGWRF